MRVHIIVQPVVFGGGVMEFFRLVGPYHKRGIRNLITIKVLYIDFYHVSKMNTGLA
jgi:hypothetical protein